MSATAQFHSFGPFHDNNGDLITAPRIYHYIVGSATLKDGWTTRDKAQTIAQPLVGDANGIASGFFDGLYKIVVKDSGGTTYYTWDNWSAGLYDTSFVNVLDYGAVGDGVTDDTTAVAAAVAAAYAAESAVIWPPGSYLTTATIPNLHDVRHHGPGVISRGGISWAVTPDRTTTRKLYVDPTGLDTNDGLTSSQPRLTIQGVINKLHQWGPIVGRVQIYLAAGSYGEVLTIPNGLAINDNYLEFKGPADPGVRGDPSSWPAGGAIIDGTGMSTSSNGVTVGAYNNVYFEYILFRDWYDTGLSATAQVVSAVVIEHFANVYMYGCSGIGNGYNNISIQPMGRAVVTGGIFDGARFSFSNTGGRLSLTATVSTYTTIRNAEEYGIHAKHNSSTVLDYTEFLDNGQNAAAATYGAALFSYKSGTSIDTRSCTFKRNNIVYNARGGHIATHPSDTDTLGAGADANDRVWLIRGFGTDDLMNYRSLGGREISVSHGGNSTTGAVAAVIFDTNGVIPASYLTDTDQHVEIEIFATNAAGGTAQVRPSFVSGGGTRYELGNFQIAAATNAHIRLIVQTSSDGTIATVWYATQGATIGGATSGVATINPVVFDSDTMEFQVWGETSAGNQLSIRKTRVVLWG